MLKEWWTYLREHPIWLGVAVFVVGIILLWLFGFFGKKQAAAPNSAAAYYAAESAANQAAAVQEQSRQQAMTQLGIAGDAADVQRAQISAAADVANTKTAADLNLGLASFDYQRHASDNAFAVAHDANLSAQTIEQIHANANENIAGLVAQENIAVATGANNRDVAINSMAYQTEQQRIAANLSGTSMAYQTEQQRIAAGLSASTMAYQTDQYKTAANLAASTMAYQTEQYKTNQTATLEATRIQYNYLNNVVNNQTEQFAVQSHDAVLNYKAQVENQTAQYLAQLAAGSHANDLQYAFAMSR